MAESTRLVDLVQNSIDAFLAERRTDLEAVSPDLDVIDSAASGLLVGGKRFRALFCYWGWQSITAQGDSLDVGAEAPPSDGIVAVAAALEIFHAAALVHDDIMDNSDLRRGGPSVHRQFESLHRERGWTGSATSFGTSAGLLLGDLLLGWSDGLFEHGVSKFDHSVATAARGEFGRMRTEVMLGQYLDMLEEHSWRSRPDADLLPRAQRVIVYKSAKYSVESPLALGALLAGASLAQVASLRDVGLPLGVAFQLRDDLLGVFGDPELTGKPAGGDLREGKRTVLINLARQKLPGSASRLVDELLGDPTLDDEQIAMLQTAIRESGAVDQVERIISRNVESALAALKDAQIAHSARAELAALAVTITRRES